MGRGRGPARGGHVRPEPTTPLVPGFEDSAVKAYGAKMHNAAPAESADPKLADKDHHYKPIDGQDVLSNLYSMFDDGEVKYTVPKDRRVPVAHRSFEEADKMIKQAMKGVAMNCR